jgi:ribosomal protein S6--L-glutamate ligase
MRLSFILETRNPPRPNQIIVEAAALLQMRGAQVRLIYPEQELWRLDTLRVDADLYLLKSDSELALSLAHSLELLGGRVLNPYDTCRKVKDKTVTAALLCRSGIPTPPSYAAGHPRQLKYQLQGSSLILKPNRGYHGVGLTIAQDPSALAHSRDYADLVFAQSYFADARKDLKLFGIGDQVFAVRKPFSADSFLQSGTPAELVPEHEEIARRCAKTFGLNLFGVDLVEEDGRAFVVDVNYFPGYRGVPGAAQLLCSFIWQQCGG